MTAHDLAVVASALLTEVGSGSDPGAPQVDPSSNHAIILALIYVVGGGLLTILGTLVATRVGRRVPVTPAPANGPDDDYRKVLDRLDRERGRTTAYSVFIDRVGYDPLKIRTGWEDLDRVRRRPGP